MAGNTICQQNIKIQNMPSIPLKYVVSFSSQDDKHPVSNLIKSDGYKKWLSGPQDKSGQIEAVFQLEQPCIISYIDIGSIWCVTLEIQVGRSDWPAGREFDTLVYAVSLMTPTECSYGKNPIKTQMFSSDVFCRDIAKQRWDRIKVVCQQPYKKSTQFGLSFLRVKTSSSVNADTETVPGILHEAKSVPVQSIQKHFLGKIQNKQKENKNDLKTKLLKISASSDSGVEHGDSLSRTAKLVLAASGPRPKVFSASSPAPNAEKAGLFSSHIDQKYGPKFQEEVNLFLAKLEVDAGDLDTITLADVRHKFEKKKKRKLTKEEKREFISLAKDFLTDMFNKKAREDNVKPNLSHDRGSCPAAKEAVTPKPNVKALTGAHVSSREITPVGKRKFNSGDDTVTPPSKKALTEKAVPLKKQMKTFEQSPSSVGTKTVNNHLKEKMSGKKLLGNTGQMTPISPFEYKGLRGGDPEWTEENVTNKLSSVGDLFNIDNKQTQKEQEPDIVCLDDNGDVTVVGTSKFGDFGVNVPWSPVNNENTSPLPNSRSGAKSRGKTRGRDKSRGRGRGRGRGRKKIDLPDVTCNSDSDSGDTCYLLSTDTPEVKGRGRGQGRGRKKNRVNSRTNTAALEIRPTGFAKCDGCNEYYGEDLLSVHQQRCQRWRGLQSGSAGTPQSPWLSSRPGPSNPVDKTPSRQPETSGKNSVGAGSAQESSNAKSPPWLLAAERRLQKQLEKKSSTNSDCNTETSPASNRDNSRGSSSLETSPVTEAQMQCFSKFQSNSQNRQANNRDQSITKVQNQNNNSENQSSRRTNSNQSISQTFGFSLGFSPTDVYVDSDSGSEANRAGDRAELQETCVDCPLCGQSFPSHIIEMHAATCYL